MGILAENALIVKTHCESLVQQVPILQKLPRTTESLRSILPAKLIIPISNLDPILESIPILKNVSGQTYKPTAESYSRKGQPQLAGQASYAAHCGLVFKSWKQGQGK